MYALIIVKKKTKSDQTAINIVTDRKLCSLCNRENIKINLFYM